MQTYQIDVVTDYFGLLKSLICTILWGNLLLNQFRHKRIDVRVVTYRSWIDFRRHFWNEVKIYKIRNTAGMSTIQGTTLLVYMKISDMALICMIELTVILSINSWRKLSGLLMERMWKGLHNGYIMWYVKPWSWCLQMRIIDPFSASNTIEGLTWKFGFNT